MEETERRKLATIKARERILECLKEHNPKQYDILRERIENDNKKMLNTIKR